MIQLNQKRGDSAGRQRILAIIVLYNTPFQESISYTSLQQAALKVELETLELSVLLYDNTPGVRVPESLPPNVKYFCGVNNRGLAEAYNFALTEALERGFEWLLTLDQDTALPEDALLKYVAKADAVASDTAVAAIVPQIIASGRVVSPNTFVAGAWPRWFARGFCGIPDRPVYAFNSGSMLGVSALRQARGYSPWFWLDNSDSTIFKKFSKLGKRVYVAGDLTLDHDFSMLNMRERISPERYSNILSAESAFWDMEMNAIAGLERTARLAGRVIKHWLRHDPPSLRRLTWKALRARLLQSRKARIASWRAATRTRLGGVVEDWGAPGRPRISVCMAADNRGHFIATQLRSIVPQLCAGDEILIVNDGSQDDTSDRTRALEAELTHLPSGPRIFPSHHEWNRGVVQTFEDAIRRANGDVLFLCDDDGIWAPDKVEKILEIFMRDPEIQLVTTGPQLIDVDGNSKHDSGLLKFRRYSADMVANMLHNKFQGSTMAFRSSLIEHILPLPAGKLFLHDAWIGLCNALAGGRAAHFEEPLLLYRRQTGDSSRKLSRLDQLRLRLQLTMALIKKRAARTLS